MLRYHSYGHPCFTLALTHVIIDTQNTAIVTDLGVLHEDGRVGVTLRHLGLALLETHEHVCKEEEKGCQEWLKKRTEVREMKTPTKRERSPRTITEKARRAMDAR